MTSGLVKRFAVNDAGRDLIVGDIHGHFAKLQEALDSIRFDHERDRLFSVGDLVDRGPDSDLALEWLDKPWFHAVAGNHEDMAIRWPNGYMDAYNYAANGGAWNISNPPDVSLQFADAFRALPIAMEIETDLGLVGIVHAECPTDNWHVFTSMLEDPKTSKKERNHLIDMAQWKRTRIEERRDDDVLGVRAVVVGHTPLVTWASLGNTIYIDTGGWLHHRIPGRDFTIFDAATLAPVYKPSI